MRRRGRRGLLLGAHARRKKKRNEVEYQDTASDGLQILVSLSELWLGRFVFWQDRSCNSSRTVSNHAHLLHVLPLLRIKDHYIFRNERIVFHGPPPNHVAANLYCRPRDPFAPPAARCLPL